MSFSLPTTNDLQDEAMAVAEGAAKAAFGTRFERVPRALFSKLSLPVLSVLAVFAFVFGTAVDATRRWGEHRATNGRFPVTNAFVHDGSEALSVVHARASEFRPLSFWSVTAHERALVGFGSSGYQRLERRPDVSSGTSRLVSGSFFAR